MTTTSIIVNVLLAATVFVPVVGLCAWAIVSSRPRRSAPPAVRRLRAADRRAPVPRPRDVPAR
jgi:hypothetical protein